MTLYRHFNSEDVLVGHWLRGVADTTLEEWRAAVDKHPKSPFRQRKTWISAMASRLDEHGLGCDLTSAAVELFHSNSIANEIIREFRDDQVHFLSELCKATGFQKYSLIANT